MRASRLTGSPSLTRIARPPTHFSLDHVDAPGAQGLDAVVDVHHSLALGHIQHDIQDDVAAGPACPHAAEEERGERDRQA